jgi:DNA invertase Pin-like site-specific DNA recombinase
MPLIVTNLPRATSQQSADFHNRPVIEQILSQYGLRQSEIEGHLLRLKPNPEFLRLVQEARTELVLTLRDQYWMKQKAIALATKIPLTAVSNIYREYPKKKRTP